MGSKYKPMASFYTDDKTPFDDFSPSYIPKFKTVEKFIEAKMTMLEEHMCIRLTDDDIIQLKRCITESQVNSVVKAIINRHWE